VRLYETTVARCADAVTSVRGIIGGGGGGDGVDT